MGKVERSIVKDCKQFGTPLPKRIQQKPRLFEGLQYVLESFFDLDSERHHGNGLMRIPWTSIVRYAKHHGFNYEETEDFVYLIRRMDSAVLSRLANEQKDNIKK